MYIGNEWVNDSNANDEKSGNVVRVELDTFSLRRILGSILESLSRTEFF